MMTTTLIAVGAALMAGCTITQGPKPRGHAPDTAIRCHDGVYEGYSDRAETAIPDDDPSGAAVGPIHIPDDGQKIEPLMVAVDISHGYVGDVEITLLYDADGDGRPDVRAPLAVFMARLNACDGEALHAYPVVLDGRLFFRDGVEAGTSAEAPVLESFVGLARGGDFHLVVTDEAPGNTGVVHGWAVFLKGDIDSDSPATSIDDARATR